MSSSAVVIVDYQNIHLTGHGLWCPNGEPPHLCLVHPLHFANQLLQRRNLLRRLLAERAGKQFEQAELEGVISFRGQPSNRHDSKNYARSLAQSSEWTRDPRSVVRYRPLKYYADGRVAEKGVDVLVALELVQRAAVASKDPSRVVILAAHDTDQEPALEMAARLAPGQIETAGWHGAKRLSKSVTSWHTALDEEQFERSRDLKPYA